MTVSLSEAEREALREIPRLLEGSEQVGRLDYRVHPDDEASEVRYRELVGDSLDEMRSADRAAFADGIDTTVLSVEEAEAWMRVIGEARLVLASRLGIEEDGWEADADLEDPAVALISYLGYLQDRLVSVL